MKTIARLAFVATFALTVSASSAPVPSIGSFAQISSVSAVTITVSGSAGINL